MFYFLGFGLHRGVSPVMPAPTAQTFQLTFARERNHCPLAPQSLARCALALFTPLSWPWTDPRPPSETCWCTGAEGSSDGRPFRSLTFPVYPSTAAPIDPEDTRSLTLQSCLIIHRGRGQGPADVRETKSYLAILIELLNSKYMALKTRRKRRFIFFIVGILSEFGWQMFMIPNETNANVNMKSLKGIILHPAESTFL